MPDHFSSFVAVRVLSGAGPRLDLTWDRRETDFLRKPGLAEQLKGTEHRSSGRASSVGGRCSTSKGPGVGEVPSRNSLSSDCCAAGRVRLRLPAGCGRAAGEGLTEGK